MNILIAPDSFKGTLTAKEVCEIVAQAFAGHNTQAFPLADGGEGMVAAWHAACGGELCTATVSGPFGQAVQAHYLLMADGTAVLELASCAGLELARPHGLNPELASTSGLGELLLHARDRGAKRVILGLGGSATNDGGSGMAHALGWRFIDSRGESFCPTGGTLRNIARIIPPAQPFCLPMLAACDVQNPLHGKQGAAYVYAPQKGADEAMVRRLDDGLRHLASILLGAEIPGSGAAGGTGFGVLAFLGGKLKPGIDLLLDSSNFSQQLAQADLVITGEGRMDAQTLHGKAPFGVLKRAQAAGVPCVAICGQLHDDTALLAAGFAAIYPCVTQDKTLHELQLSCRANLRRAAHTLQIDWRTK
ncbi:MAG: glycerate kinase [Oscillospiraceae bacterium]|nr:glycerate kinase [Oscillospiraceae bacterium]